jgi:predicted ATPase
MRFKHLHIIGEYKNLKDFKLDFDGTSFIDVFVGKNGTGKSNLFEAIMEIFKHIFNNEYPIIFDYKLTYELNGQEVLIYRKDGKWRSNEQIEIPFVNKELLPSNILIYYSGHNDTIGDFITEFNLTHREKLNRNRNNENFNSEDARLFFGIGKEYKNILLASTLLQSDDLNLKQIIKQKLSIDSVESEIKLVFEKPFFASKDSTFDEFDPNARFWGAQGYFRGILNEIWDVEKIANTPVREEGKIITDDTEEYILYRSFEDFKNKFSGKSIFEIFITFDNLKTIGLLKEIDIQVTLISGKKISLGQFSDGQFQSVYILSITEIFKELNCISLLDEPDAFLHPEWQFAFFDQLNEISNASSKSNHVLMSSHSASTLTKIDESTIRVFEIEDHEIVQKRYPKSQIIHALSSGLITFSESEAKLNINHFLNNTSGAVLFTEGITDEMILETAWNKLYPGQKPNFEIQNAYSCAFLRNILKDESLYARFPNKIFFSIFDFDEAFNDWNQLGTEIVSDPTICLVKKFKTFESYAMLLPVTNPTISNQVLNPNTGKTFGNRSLLTIELLFYGVPGIEQFFVVDPERTDGFTKFINDSQKVRFAEEIVPFLDASHFEVFRPIFSFIETKIAN